MKPAHYCTEPIDESDIVAGAKRSCSVAVALLTFSTVVTLVGMGALILYNGTPGAASSPPLVWPAATKLERTGNEPTLLVFAHPFCRCTDATITGLSRLRSLRPGSGAAVPAVTFVVLGGENDPAWNRTDLTDKAAAVPNSRFVWDDGGQEAKRFGARTSGLVVLYSARGKLLFAGGVTGSRGHEGDNLGLSALKSALESTAAAYDPIGPPRQ